MSIKNDRDISNWLYPFFGLALLFPEEVRDCFAKDFISNMPNDKKVESFTDYVLSTYVDSTSFFSPIWLAEVPSDTRCTNKRTEAFHSHYKEQLHASHASVFYIWMPLLSSRQQHN